MRPTARLVAAVSALWTLVGIVWGAQSSLAASLQGEPEPLGPAIASALHQSLPWIPATLAVIVLASRFPVGRGTWRRHLWIHLLAWPALAFGTNVLVVLGYWAGQGRFGGLGRLAQQGALWGLLRLHVAALLYAAGVAATQWVRDRHQMRERELALARTEASLERARLQVLTAQIRPHFLFNTLHAIGQLWRSGDADRADALLDHLGSLFQKVIASTTRTSVPLARELEMVRDYLAIERGRFRDRLRARIDASEAALACRVPPLLLQPLVENAVRHGVSASASGGEVAVEARVEGDRLVLVVRDDGPGPGADPTTAGTGTALANLRERLCGTYGERHRLETGPGPAGGTVVRVELPAHTGDATGADADEAWADGGDD